MATPFLALDPVSRRTESDFINPSSRVALYEHYQLINGRTHVLHTWNRLTGQWEPGTSLKASDSGKPTWTAGTWLKPDGVPEFITQMRVLEE